MDNIVFTTDQLILRKLNINDAVKLLEIFSDPEMMEYHRVTRNLDETKEWIQQYLESYEKHGFGRYAAILKDTNEFIGYAGFAAKEIDGQPEVEIGYTLNKKFWGQGYATEAALACRDYAFDTLGLKRIVAIIYPDNAASINVAKKIGMEFAKKSARDGEEFDIYAINKI